MIGFLRVVGVVGFVGTIAFILISSVVNRTPRRSSPSVSETVKVKPASCGSAEALLRELGASPRREWREVQFSHRDWDAISFDNKKFVVTKIAECLAPAPSTSVIDDMTGKELASYSPLWGVKIN